jgi:glycosyltransferase involved in cell wall biosynthesis
LLRQRALEIATEVNIYISSKLRPTYHGGLASYQQALIRLLAKEPNIKAQVIYSDQASGVLPESDISSSFSGRMIQERWFAAKSSAIRSRLASRPLTHSLLEKLLSVSWRFPSDLDPDLIHFVGTGWDFFGFGLAHEARKRRRRLTILPAVHPRSWGDDRIDLRLYERADVVFCLTEHERKHLEALGIPRAKSIKCPLPPMCRSDGDANRFRTKYNLEDRSLVLFLGRRDEGKGFSSLLTAWSAVAAKVPEAVLILAGPGQLGSQDQLVQLPFHTVCDVGIPNEIEKADALAACDVFCLPSAHESFGIVYVEAWSYAKAVICGSAPASRELIENGRTGLWSSQHPDDLAEKLVLLLRNSQLRECMGAAGLALQRAQFNERTFLDVHLKAFGVI